MKVAGGWARGRRLVAPRGGDTRPTPARVREALASMVASRRGPFDGHEQVLDLFAGTGALGLECLSRGAGGATFVEPSPVARSALCENIARLGVASRAQVLALPAAAALATLARARATYALVLCDPPFAAHLWAEILGALGGGALCTPGALVVCEHPTGCPPPLLPPLVYEATRAFGAVALTLFSAPRRGVAPSPRER